MKFIAAAALIAGLTVAAGAHATVIFSEDFSGYSLPTVNGGNTAGVSSSAGHDSFTTAYSFRTGASNTGPDSMYDEGTWTIGTNPVDVHSLWIDKPSNNPFLMLNGATNDQSHPTAYESNGIHVAAGTYDYSYQLLNLCCNIHGPVGTPSVLQLWYFKPGQNTPTNIDFTQDTVQGSDQWETVSGHFTIAAPGGTIHLGLSDNSAIASGNDFGVDNIRLASVPEPASWALMIVGFGSAGAMLRRRRQGAATA